MNNLITLTNTCKDLTKSQMKLKIEEIEDLIKNYPGSKTDDSDLCPVKHHFTEGVYAREMFIPKNTMLVGKIHKHEYFNFILKGDMTVVTESGVKRVKGPGFAKAPAGQKRAGYAHEDTLWFTVHPNEIEDRDIDKLEERLVTKTFSEYEKYVSNRITDTELSLGSNKIIPLPVDNINTYRNANGMFTSRFIRQGEIIGPVRINDKITPLGKYINNDIRPNTMNILLENNDLVLVSLTDINKNTEITVNYKSANMLAQGGGE